MKPASPLSRTLRQKLKDHKKHRVKTTGFPELYVDNVRVYRARPKRAFPIVAMAIGFAIGLIIGHFLASLF